MKTLNLLISLFISCVVLAQNRDLTITVKNNSGKPIKFVKVETFPSNLKGSTDKNGLCILNGISDDDSLIVIYPNADKSATYSLKELKEIQFNPSLNNPVGYDPIGDLQIFGKERKIVKKGEIDLENEIKNGALNLEDLLKKMPSLMVTGGEISFRNPVITKALKEVSPLIVVDNMIVRGGLQEANRIVNIHMIESIKLEKDGTLWGPEGLNGVILITLKK